MSVPSPTTSESRFAIRVDPLFRWLFTVMGAPPGHDVVEVDERSVHVRLSWMFRATIDRSAIAAVRHHADMVGGWGAHGFAGRWLVNGSSHGIVEVILEPRQRAFVIGVPVRLRTLWVSFDDPDGFIAAVGGEADTP